MNTRTIVSLLKPSDNLALNDGVHFSLGQRLDKPMLRAGMVGFYAVAVGNHDLEAQGVRENGLRKAAKAANTANAKGGLCRKCRRSRQCQADIWVLPSHIAGKSGSRQASARAKMGFVPELP